MSLWIRFRDQSLCQLLEGVEACCRHEDGKVRSKDWVEDGRDFRLKLCSNGVRRFIFYLVSSIEDKRFTLNFPKGKGILGAVFILAKKLHCLLTSNKL